LLTSQKEVELAAKIKKGDKKAREHMIKANLRLVVTRERVRQLQNLALGKLRKMIERLEFRTVRGSALPASDETFPARGSSD